MDHVQCRVEVTTATDVSQNGNGKTYILTRNGEVVSSRDTAVAHTGTTVSVTGIFLPYPVRRKKFLRSKKASCTDVKDVVVLYSLARPDVRFHYKARDPGDEMLKTPTTSLRNTIRDVFKPRNVLDILDYFASSASASTEIRVPSDVKMPPDPIGERDLDTTHGVSLEVFFPKDRRASLTKAKRYLIIYPNLCPSNNEKSDRERWCVCV